MDQLAKKLSVQVNSTSNVANNLNDRFDRECITLTQEFLQKMKNDKLVFYFNKKFLNKPKVLITIKSMQLNQPKEGTKIDFKFDVKEENIDLTHFKFSIEQKFTPSETKNDMPSLKNAEVCYLAFEELKISVSS